MIGDLFMGALGMLGAFDEDVPDRPLDRNTQAEWMGTLGAYEHALPKQYSLLAQYTPAYTDVANKARRQVTLSSASALRDVMPELTAANTTSRTADVRDVATLAPGLGQSLLNLDAPSASLLNTLTAQAGEELAAGDRLTPGQRRDVAQRAGSYYNRGLAPSGATAFTNALEEELARRGAQGERRNFAGNVVNTRNAIVQPAAGMILNRAPNAVASGQSLLAQSAGGVSAPNVDFQSPYAQDVFDSNWNRRWDERNTAKDWNRSMFNQGLQRTTSGINWGDEQVASSVQSILGAI